jgi:diguanylate cyclase (GGDEF)-like protein
MRSLSFNLGYRFLTSGIVPTDPTMLRTLVLANALLFITSLACFGAFLYNLSYNQWLATFDAIASLVSFFAIIDLRKNNILHRAIIIGSTNLFLFLIAFTYTNGSGDFGLIWTIFFPIFVITLMGHKKGLLLTGLFYAIILSMAYYEIGVWDHGNWRFKGFLRLTIASFIVTYIMYVYESFVYHANLELHYTREKEAQYLEELRIISITDPLTGLYNRRRMNQVLQQQVDAVNNDHSPFSLIIFDVDDFKHINDKFGHNIGDRVLMMIAGITKDLLWQTDHVGRWGGEEFLVLLPQTDLTRALDIAEKLRQQIENAVYPHQSKVSCSFGVAQYHEGIDINSFVNQADSALYRAKNSGKNCVMPTDDLTI